MSFRRLISLSALVALLCPVFGQSPKKALTVEDFPAWKVLAGTQLSHDGSLATWEVNAQQYGDGELHLKQLPDGAEEVFERGGNASLSAGNTFLAFRISAHFDSVRQAKLDEVDSDDMPKDSLGIWLMERGELRKIPRLASFQVSESAGAWMAYQLEKAPKKETNDSTATDSAATDTAAKVKPPKEPKEQPLILWDPVRDLSLEVPAVESYVVPDSGRLIAMITVSGDSVDSVQVRVFDPVRMQVRLIYAGMGKASDLTFDETGRRLAFLATQDTGEVKFWDLYGYQYEEAQARKLVDTATAAMPDGWAVSENGNVSFSESGNRLFFGIAPAPQPEPEDTLLSDEKVRVDIWNWQDQALQPEQKLDAQDEKNRTYESVWFWNDARMVQLETETMKSVRLPGDEDGPWALGYVDDQYAVERSWAYPWREDIYLVNVNTGEASLLKESVEFGLRLAPEGSMAVYWDADALAWMSLDPASGKVTNLTGDLKVNFYDEDHDVPSKSSAYGFEGFLEGEQYGLFYDRYDVWKIRLDGSEKAVNLTKGWGRKEKVRLRGITLDWDAEYVAEELLAFGFHEADKREGVYAIQTGKREDPTELILSAHSYGYPTKAENTDRLIWRRESYDEYPDLYTSGMDFANPVKLSDANPQTAEYAWGSVQLVTWTAYDGTELEGLLYTPGNFDPNKKYPLLVYFYELVSDRMNNYSMPSPSRSIIYPSYYASNGYAIFMPNIRYTEGQPGDDAYNCIVSGTEAMVEQFDWIDKERMALQGQSWGGYQTAYLVTKTDLYACAMAGAPVSNMTSAYGGIRWGSGLSRAFQYERTQSRLGVTLWEDRDRYISQSPVFFADHVTTPLLMMHNDADGAVPWYQGIEYFTALRRLQKPVWMLVYNDEEHNLTRWPNRVDLTIRMHQFFDHYLLDKPAPVWMSEGVKAVDKGRKTGYELSGE